MKVYWLWLGKRTRGLILLVEAEYIVVKHEEWWKDFVVEEGVRLTKIFSAIWISSKLWWRRGLTYRSTLAFRKH